MPIWHRSGGAPDAELQVPRVRRVVRGRAVGRAGRAIGRRHAGLGAPAGLAERLIRHRVHRRPGRRGRALRCGAPRDRLFGVLGLGAAGRRQRLRPDAAQDHLCLGLRRSGLCADTRAQHSHPVAEHQHRLWKAGGACLERARRIHRDMLCLRRGRQLGNGELQVRSRRRCARDRQPRRLLSAQQDDLRVADGRLRAGPSRVYQGDEHRGRPCSDAVALGDGPAEHAGAGARRRGVYRNDLLQRCRCAFPRQPEGTARGEVRPRSAARDPEHRKRGCVPRLPRQERLPAVRRLGH